MNDYFYIIDDDKVVQKVLKDIIMKHNLGDVVGVAEDGDQALEEIPRLKPDIVLVDLLLPEIDGIGIVSALKEKDCESAFIMISEVSAKNMISKAYEKGVEFYINKPINVIEVISIIKKVKERINMSKVIQSFENAMEHVSLFKKQTEPKDVRKVTGRDQVERILAKIGILGEAGHNDIIEIILWLQKQDPINKKGVLSYKLSQLYGHLNEMYEREYGISANVNAIEQRVRRAIYKGLQNLANLGIEDYGNDVFNKYSSMLYDFKEVRRQMDYARGKSKVTGKISIKKFIEGVLVCLRNDL